MALALFPALLAAADLQVSARLSADRAGTDDAVALIVTVQGDTPDTAPQLPALPDFRLLGGPSVSQQVSIVNMSMSKSVTYTWELQPLKTGTLTIDPIAVQAGGKTYKTRPLTLEAVQGSVQQGRRGRSRWPFDGLFDDPFQEQRQTPAGEVLLRAVADKRSAYPGEQITLTYELLTQVQIRGISQEKAPAYDGFWVESVELPQQPEGRWVELDGKRFMAYPLRKDLLFAAAPGTATLPPVEFRLQAITAEGPFGFGSVKEIIRASAPVVLSILELPGGKPEGFGGAVGQFSVTAATDKVEVREGDALAYRLTVKGTGNLKTFAAPALPPLPDCKVYDPKVEEKVTSKGGALTGSKTWEWVIIPGSRQMLRIPPVPFAWFDPVKGAYVSAKAPELAVRVKPGEPGSGASPAVVVAGGEEVKAVGRDLAWISTDDRPLGAERAPLTGRAWFWTLLVLPFLGNAGLWAALKQSRARAADPLRMRARKARAAAAARLDEARNAQGAEFHRIVRSALSGFAGDRSGRSGEGLSLEALDALLAARGADPALCARVRRFLEERDRALYAPGGADEAARGAVLDEARALLKALEKIL
jgi:hypothetical protein